MSSNVFPLQTSISQFGNETLFFVFRLPKDKGGTFLYYWFNQASMCSDLYDYVSSELNCSKENFTLLLEDFESLQSTTDSQIRDTMIEIPCRNNLMIKNIDKIAQKIRFIVHIQFLSFPAK